VLLGTAGHASAQIDEFSHRLKKQYDFEDSDERGNKIGYIGHLMPRNWYVIGQEAVGADSKFKAIPLHQALQVREGYSPHAKVGFDKSQKTSGDFSLHLGLAGGSTGVFIQHGAINVKPASDYRVSVQVRTAKLDHAWAELRAYFIDKNGSMIQASLQKSEPVETQGQWQTISVKLPGEYEDVAYMGIELHIIQPKADPDSPLGDHQVVPADIDGGAWFDDVSVWELPSVSIGTGVATNIVKGASKPALHARIRDLTGQRLRAVMSVYDYRYQPVDRIEEDIDKEGWSWEPNLDGRYGWYWADLEIYETDSRHQPTTRIARTVAGFLWLPQGSGRAGDDRSRFEIVAEDVPTDEIQLVAQLMDQAQLNSLVISAWERRSTPKTTAERARIIEPILRDLAVKRGKVAVSFWPMPVELTAREGVDTIDPLNLLVKPSDHWLDYAKPFLSQLGQRLSHWQIGSSHYPHAFLSRDLASDIDAARRGIRAAAPSPRLIAPWRLDQPNRSESLLSGDSYALAWPQGVVPGKLAEALADWPIPPQNVRLDIELADAVDMTHERRVADLMIRVLQAWELEVGSVALAKPWTQAHSRDIEFTPDPVLGAWINLSQLLDGQRVIGRMPLGNGLVALILDGLQGGMLAVWNETADKDPDSIAIYLGQSPVAIDPFGNATPLTANAQGQHLLPVSKTPTIIRGIDAHVAMLRAGFKVDRPFIQSLQVAHPRTLKIHNPWPRTLNGQLVFVGPEDWTIQPQRKFLSIAPGDTAEVPISIRFPIHENGGPKELTAEIQFNVGEDYAITLATPIEVGLEGVSFDAAVIVEPGLVEGTVDAIVTMTVANTSDTTRSLNLFAGLQDHARRELIIPGIAPGEFVSRRIRFKDVGKQIGETQLRCGVRESNGPAVLNKTLDLLPPRQKQSPPEIAGVETP